LDIFPSFVGEGKILNIASTLNEQAGCPYLGRAAAQDAKGWKDFWRVSIPWPIAEGYICVAP
jgi:hypothetical protein